MGSCRPGKETPILPSASAKKPFTRNNKPLRRRGNNTFVMQKDPHACQNLERKRALLVIFQEIKFAHNFLQIKPLYFVYIVFVFLLLDFLLQSEFRAWKNFETVLFSVRIRKGTLIVSRVERTK